MSRANEKTTLSRLLLMVALLAILALGIAGCGGGDAESSDDAVDAALEKASDIKSGKAEMKASILTGSLPPSFDIVGGGPFDTEAEGGVAYDLDLVVQVAGTDQDLGFTSVGGKSYLKVGDKAAELDGDTSASMDAGSIKDFIDSLGNYVTETNFEEERNLGKDKLKVYRIIFDVKKLLAELTDENKALSNFSVPGLGSVDELAAGVQNGTGSIGVAPDGFPRVISVNVPIARASVQSGIRVTLTLTEINQPQTIEPPENIVPRSDLGGIADFIGG